MKPIIKPNKLLYLSLTLLVLSLLLNFFITPKKQHLNSTVTSNTPTTSPKVLGDESFLNISDSNNYYSKQGLINKAFNSNNNVSVSGKVDKNKVTLFVYKANKKDVLKFLTHNSDHKQVYPNPNTDEMAFVTSFDLDLKSNNSYEPNIVTLPLENEGIYYVKATAKNVTNGVFVNKSKIAVLNQEADGSQVYWVQNLETGKTIENGGLSVYSLLDNYNEIKEYKIENNVIKTPIMPNAHIAIFESGNSTAILPLNYIPLLYGYSHYGYTADQQTSKMFLYTDRPLYKPGEKIYFKSIARLDKDGNFKIPNNNFTVELSIGWGDEKTILYQKNLSPNSFGSISGEITIPENAKTGNYYLSVKDNQYNTSESLYIPVEYFRKPEYTIEVTKDKNEYIQGDEVVAKVNASYFFGQPLKDKQVEYTVTAARYYYSAFYDYYKLYSNNDFKYYYWWGDKTLATGKVTLNDKGEAEIKFKADLSNTENSQNPYVVRIEVSYKDSTGNPVDDSVNVLVHPVKYSMYALKNVYSIKPNTTIEFPLILVDNLTNNPKQNQKLNINISRKWWEKITDSNNKYGYKYEERNESVSTENVVSDSKGVANILVKGKHNEGTYLITATGEDSVGNKIKEVFYLYISDYSYWGTTNNVGHISMQLDKNEYKIGDNAKVTLTSDKENVDYFVQIQREFIHDYKIVKFENEKTKTIEFKIEDYAVPNMTIVANTFIDSDLYSNYQAIKVSKEDKLIKTQITSDKKQYKPGETVTLNVKTTDYKGSPLSSEVGVWVFDKAILELVPASNMNILDDFWRERYNSTFVTHSLQNIEYSAAEKGGCFLEGTKVLTKNGTANIEDIKIGEKVLSKNFDTNLLEEKNVTGTHKTEVSSLVVINNNIKVTPNHFLYINNKWATANSVKEGDTFTTDKGGEIKVTSVEYITGKFTVYNLQVADNHNFFAQNILVHNDKGGARNKLKNTAYWNPYVVTNEEGKATVSFKIPDNLTTWVVNGISNTTNSKFGNTTSEIIVSKDIVVRPVLPNVLRTKEKVYLSTIVHNFTDKTVELTTGLDFKDAKINSNVVYTDKFDPKESKEYFFEAEPQVENKNSKLTFFTYSKNNKDLKDSVEQIIPIYDFGFYNYKSYFFSTDVNNLPIEISKTADNSKSFVKVYLSSSLFGSLPSSMQYLLDYPYGCVEQTTSRFVPIIIANNNKEYFKDIINNKNLLDMAKVGIDNLVKLQKDDGGWTWWYVGESDPFITSYVVEYLSLAKNSGINFDDNILNNAKIYLEKGGRKYNPDTKKEESSFTADQVAFQKYALEILGSKVSRGAITNFDKLSTDSLSFAVMYNYKLGVADPNKNGASVLISRVKKDSYGNFWQIDNKDENNKRFGSKDSTTALATRALLTTNSYPDVVAEGIRYLKLSKASSYWSNTYATAQTLRTISEFNKLKQESSNTVGYKVLLGDKIVKQGSVVGSTNEVVSLNIPNLKSNNNISIIKTSGDNLYTNIDFTEFETDKSVKPHKNNNIEISRTYTNEKGVNYNYALGDTVLVKIAIRNIPTDSSFIVVEDTLPAGLIPINEYLDNVGNNMYYWNGGWSTQYKLDGIISTLYTYQSSDTITYRARVISQGVFTAPPVKMELMYNPEIKALSDSNTIEASPTSTKLYDLIDTSKNITRILQDTSKKPVSKLLVIILILIPVLVISFIVFIIKRRRNALKIKQTTNNTNTPNNDSSVN